MNSQPLEHKILGGDLATMGLQATLKMLSLGAKTGCLNVMAVHTSPGEGRPERERMEIYLKRGSIVALHSSETGTIDFLEILRLMQRLHRDRANELRMRYGTMLPAVLNELVRLNLITPLEQQQRMEFAILQEVARAMRWEHGTFEFNVNVEAADTPLTPLNVDHVLLEALRMVDEWSKITTQGLTRYSIPRWLPDFTGDVRNLQLSREDVHVLFLANGQVAISGIAFGLMTSEAMVAHSVEHLVTHHLVELVNDKLERELELSLSNALTVSQGLLRHDNRLPPEQRLQMLINAMGTCLNKLLSHHGRFARAMRNLPQNAPHAQMYQYLEQVFLPLLRQVQREYQILDAIGFQDGQLEYHELIELHKTLKGVQLETYYWDAAQGFHQLMHETFAMIMADEIGPSRASRRFIELWETFAREIDEEMDRQRVRRIALNPSRQSPGA